MDEDFAPGASVSLHTSIRRIRFRAACGHWPSEPIGPLRREFEREVELLLSGVAENARQHNARNEVGSTTWKRHRGQWIPK